ncbi:MAG: hypothetical protein HYS56_01485, partial [Candidatus Omnitrophica bacterium]|nr:hypothetical protein [Candidatus Omnitrophota bacterium]
MNSSFKRISWFLIFALLIHQPVLPILVERKQNTLSPVASIPPLPGQANVGPRLTNIKTVSQIFDQDELERYVYFDTVTGNEISLRDKFDQLEKEYQRSFHTALASAAIDPETGRVTHDPAVMQSNIEKAEEIRKKVVRSFYEIGKTALDIEDSAGQVITFINPKTGAQEQRPYPKYAKNYVVALYALRKAIQMRPLTQQAYSESVLGSDYRPAYEVFPQLHSGESGFNEEIKDADKLYDNAVQRFYSDKRVTKAEIVIKNIQYDLGISVDWLFHGGAHTGRTFRELWEMALGLRALLLDKTDSRVTDGIKGRAAEFLAALFTTYIHNTSVSAKLDEGGGLTIPDEVYSASKRSSLEEFKKGEAVAFGLFAYNADFVPELGTTLRGHSVTVTGWLARLYRSMARHYYSSSVKDALELETQRIYPRLGGFMNEIHLEAESFKKIKGGEQEAREALSKMMEVYRQQIPQALPEFREGKVTGLITEEPVRIEFSPGPIGDSSRLSTDMPHLYCILNGSGVLTRDDGSIGRNIEIEVQIQDLDKMKKQYIQVSNEISAEPLDVFITVQSLDTNFTVDVENAQTIQAKTDARLVLHTLAAMGIFPLEMLDVAVKARQEKEVLREILAYILGEGKGLVIRLNVKKIAPNSGLAVSSLIATGVTTAFSRLLGLRVNGVRPDQPYETEQEKIVTVTLDAQGPEGNEIGFYYVQISPSPQFREGETLTYTTDLVEETLEIDVPLDDLKRSQSWHVRSRFIVCGREGDGIVEIFDDIPV